MPESLDNALREMLTATATVPDDGFSERVMGALPVQGRSATMRTPLLVGMTALGWVIAMVVLRGGEFLQGLLQRLPKIGSLGSIPIHWLFAIYLLAWITIMAALEERAGAHAEIAPKKSR